MPPSTRQAPKSTPGSPPEAAHPAAKGLIDFGPLAAFLLTYYIASRSQPEAGIYWATGVLMVATVIALAASRLVLGRFSLPPLVTAALVVVFGGLTLWLQDPRFVMMKPTIINLIFAGVLTFGIVKGRPLLKLLMGEALKLTDEGWHKLTVRWIGFFVSMALLNEAVWRNFSESTWVDFKVLGIIPLTVLFAVAQVGLIKRHEAKTEDAALP
jgi:intracellular septation protein